jgi:protein-disulfide isomerase
MTSRRRLLSLVLAVSVVAGGAAVAAAPAASGKLPVRADDMSLGSPKAKVQVVEYASLSCPHCARFNADVFPAFKAKYVDTGKVRYTLREMLTPPAEVAAAGYMLARCAGPDKYFKVVAEVFRSQSSWDGDIKPVFLGIAKSNGLTEAQFESCLSSQANLEAINTRVKAAIDGGVSSTPTFFINGKKHEGEMTLEQLDAAIVAARK